MPDRGRKAVVLDQSAAAVQTERQPAPARDAMIGQQGPALRHRAPARQPRPRVRPPDPVWSDRAADHTRRHDGTTAESVLDQSACPARILARPAHCLTRRKKEHPKKRPPLPAARETHQFHTAADDLRRYCLDFSIFSTFPPRCRHKNHPRPEKKGDKNKRLTGRARGCAL